MENYPKWNIYTIGGNHFHFHDYGRKGKLCHLGALTLNDLLDSIWLPCWFFSKKVSERTRRASSSLWTGLTRQHPGLDFAHSKALSAIILRCVKEIRSIWKYSPNGKMLIQLDHRFILGSVCNCGCPSGTVWWPNHPVCHCPGWCAASASHKPPTCSSHHHCFSIGPVT